MYLFHYTYPEYIEKIEEEGLKVGEKLAEIEMFGDEIEKYKPERFPEFVNFNEAIFFNPVKRKDSQQPYIVVDSEKLNQAKIYVADKMIVTQLWHEIINVPYGAMSSGLSVEMLAQKFWDRLVAVEKYKNMQKKYKRIEILYFDVVGRKDVEIWEK